MTDLTEFLLARIAEDEARQTEWANSWHAANCRSNATGGRGPCCGVPARVLAECDAKRRIVVDISVVVLEPFGVQWPEGYKEALGHTLRLLALPYADHPEYREEWRP